MRFIVRRVCAFLCSEGVCIFIFAPSGEGASPGLWRFVVWRGHEPRNRMRTAALVDWHVELDDEGDGGHIDPACEDVGGDEEAGDALAEVVEYLRV